MQLETESQRDEMEPKSHKVRKQETGVRTGVKTQLRQTLTKWYDIQEWRTRGKQTTDATNWRNQKKTNQKGTNIWTPLCHSCEYRTQPWVERTRRISVSGMTMELELEVLLCRIFWIKPKQPQNKVNAATKGLSLSLSPVCIPWLFQRLLPFPNNMSGCGPVWTVTTSQKEKKKQQQLPPAAKSSHRLLSPSSSVSLPHQDRTGPWDILFCCLAPGWEVGVWARGWEKGRRRRGGAEEEQRRP